MNNPSIPKRYAVRSLLGEGGSSRVYRVQDSIRDRELALKLVTAAESAFLRREFDTLRQIRHENLIQVFDWGALPSGEAYYTMELIEGGDWSGRMGKAQPADDVRHILTGLLRGLAHLHCHGEIHGDLKPANILLGAGGVVKITDVGMGGSGRSASGLSGTPGYAAPEVWEGSRADVRSDLYSVGVMTYEALTGKHPFAGRTVREVISGQLEGWVPSPGVHGRQVPADLERVVMRAVERKPGLRQGSADEFMEGFGVEDRIGEILGGKLVGREKEIAEIEKLLYSEEPGTPTLLYVTGEPGIGKTALLNEIAHRLLNAAARVVDLDFSIRVSPEEQLSTSLELSATSDLPKLLLDLGNDSPLLIHARLRNLDDPASESFCRSLARYVWALSMEVGRASHILFALRGSKTEHPDRFEQVIRVSPLSGTHFGGALRYFLGAEDLKSELVAKLMSLTGGNPGMLRSALVSLIDRRLLDRRDGIWRFREATQIQSLSIEPESNPWFPAWHHLDSKEQSAMMALSLLSRIKLDNQLPSLEVVYLEKAVLSSLEGRGWVRHFRGSWSPASDGIQQVVLSQGSAELQLKIATHLLESRDVLGDSDELADLELRYRPSLVSLERALEGADSSLKKGDTRTAIDRMTLCLNYASRTGQFPRARSIGLRLALLLHQLGDPARAASTLRLPPFEGDSPPGEAGRRFHLLGQIAMARGDLDNAKDHLGRAAVLADSAKDTQLLLQCHADLAEIDWRHGGEESRKRAIDRVRQVLRQHSEDQSLRNERAALMYGLGAAMIVDGASRESIEILQCGFDLAESGYWKMRIANAMSSASQYLGEPIKEGEWLDRAWRLAESSSADAFKARILSNRGSWLLQQGRFAEAADQNKLAASWARRFGNNFEFAAGCAGWAMCSIHVARYEDALVGALDVRRASETINDLAYIAKAFEIEGLANHFLGRDDLAEKGIREALGILSGQGYVVVRPRLEWLLARVLRRKGEDGEWEVLLGRAEAQLRETRDPEDLLGVQIEMHLGRSRNGNAESSIADIAELFGRSERSGLVVIAVPAALAVAEILHDQALDHREFKDLLAAGLEMAERSGMREQAWQLGYRMGALAARAGQRREAQSKFTLASRIIRQIAGELSDDHRRSYLGAVHVISAIEGMDSAL